MVKKSLGFKPIKSPHKLPSKNLENQFLASSGYQRA